MRFGRLSNRLSFQPIHLKCNQFKYSNHTSINFSTTTIQNISDFPGARSLYTTDLKFRKNVDPYPCFRLMDEKGILIKPDLPLPMGKDILIKMYKDMCTLHTMDQIFYDAQRQGRISFYMQNVGEEATGIGSSAALQLNDVVFPQYREAGMFLWRGFTLEEFAHQCFSNAYDVGKGRQMPVHYGSRKLNVQTISSPLSTQIPQAVGAAYALKLNPNNQNCAICYFGEGAASEGDFHAACNMASTLDCPVIFFVRNNGYAISTPTKEQYRGDGIMSRGIGYGMYATRVDGNDLLAVYEATKQARSLCISNNAPVLIEAMTYRGSHHSTSDDSSRYRPNDEIRYWHEKNNPVTRVRLLLLHLQLWDNDMDTKTKEEARKQVLEVLLKAENSKKPPIRELFTDVYDKMTIHLEEQYQQLMDHLNNYGKHYKLDDFMEEKEYVDPSKEN